MSIAIETAVSFARTSMFRETGQWTERFADRTLGVKSSVIRDLLKLTERPDVISFAGGLPAPEVFPIARIEAATRRVLEERGQSALQYGTTEGYLPLREMLVRHMSRYGVRVTPDNVLVTSGAQQALDLVGKLFLNPGDIVLTEEPTYLGAIQAFTAYQAQYLTVPMDDEGLRMDDLETALHAGPKFLYVLPNFQNPGGTTLSQSRRERLVELARTTGPPSWKTTPMASSATRANTCRPWRRSRPIWKERAAASTASRPGCSIWAPSPRCWHPGSGSAGSWVRPP